MQQNNPLVYYYLFGILQNIAKNQIQTWKKKEMT